MFINLKIKIFRLLKWLKLIKNNFDQPLPIFTKNSDGLKVHLGSGEINLQGWINIDANQNTHIHMIDKNFKLNNLKDETISEFYLCHVLEHFSFTESIELIKKIQQKLKKNGVIRISVPDFQKLSSIYSLNSNLDQIKFALMGGQKDNYDYHKSIYDHPGLTKILEDCKFGEISEWNYEDFGVKIGDWSEGYYKVQNKKIEISLNLKGIKL